ncbi:hypothetical protein EYM_05900 [Ignicoccus islandicus DSM 13165]|uniref:Antitoxin n=1 Tax=Ignicoccus islandicus DSM 13165 TaxID=940295 RepID=A0A0U3F8D4_9CREN|nr:antitoxin family protein [Ignicoccus islandicus]ALU11897.1 hypothetical protein EYM_05900 [Ignicoccus islandicus DSM 13165]
MSKVVRVRYEKGVLKPLDRIEFREGEELRVVILPREFPELLREVEVEAKEDIDKVLREARERWRQWY